MAAKTNKTVLVILAKGFEDIEAVTPIDMLNRAGANVTISGMETRPVRGAFGSTIIGHTTIDKVEGIFDALVIPGGVQSAEIFAANPLVIDLIKRHHENGKLIAVSCASPGYLLAEAAGILKGRRATGDPALSNRLIAAGAVVTNELVTVDGNLITGIGPGSAMLFTLEIIENLFDRETADSLAREWRIDRHKTPANKQMAAMPV